MDERAEPDVKRILREQRRYYEDRASEYDDVWYRRGIYDLGSDGNRRWFEETARLEAAVDQLDVCGVVLELASGTGLFTRHLAPRAERLIAVDAAPAAIAINRARVTGPNVEHVRADLFRWEPPEGVRFDLIFFAFLISHILPDRLEEFWDRVTGWLAPGGHVFFCDDLEGAEGRRSNPGESVENGPAFAHRRRLRDGREYTIVKVYYGTAELCERLLEFGWDADIHTTGEEFFYATARPIRSRSAGPRTAPDGEASRGC
jgi:SAM-dependent methyltransferase